MSVALLCADPINDLSFSISPVTESGQPTTFPVSIPFSGTLTDNDTANTCDSSFTDCLYLNNIGITFNPSDPTYTSTYLSLDTFPFFNELPLGQFLSDDGPTGPYYTETGTIFGIYIDPNTPVGVYTGEVTIYGGIDDPNANVTLGSVDFTLNVIAPEPAPFGLALLGLAAVVVARRSLAA
jgi:hypothetical protein